MARACLIALLLVVSAQRVLAQPGVVRAVDDRTKAIDRASASILKFFQAWNMAWRSVGRAVRSATFRFAVLSAPR